MSAVLFLSDLAPEVIFAILARCDIASVVSVGQTCQYLHALAFDKSVWKGLLDNLQRRAILDQNCTPRLETLSTDEMIGVVRRILTGPLTWSAQDIDSDSAPEVTKTITLHPIGNAPRALGWGSRAKLLPSGRYILFYNSGVLECWNVTDDKMVWRYTTAMEHAEVYDFTAEEREIESTIVILICIRIILHDHEQLNYVEIVSVDLQSGTQNHLLTARAPDSDPAYDTSLSDPAMCGNLAAVNTDRQHMIINWAAKSYFIFDGHADSTTCIALIPHHIILVNRYRNREGKIHLISNDVISAYMIPIITPDGDAEFSPILAEDIPKRSTFVDINAEQSFDGIHVRESPLREGDYRLWIHGMNHAANGGGLFSCTLSIPNNTEPRWCQRSRSVGLGRVPYTPLSYSGHSLQYSWTRPGEYIIFSAACPATPKHAVGMPEFHGGYIGLAAYSGALTCCTRSSIVLQYYK